MQRRSFDLVLMGVILVFAFLAASFAVRNSDFWLHLASGRLLAEGRYQFGVDPFAFTTEHHYWANHAWLFDLLLYLLYSRLGEQLGGMVLVILKALLISFLALVLLSMRRPDSRLGWPAACTLLAVLAMSPRLLLHSTCLSYVLLVLTLWLLWARHYIPLLLLFVLWVNVDGWFLLGPLLAALFWLGERLQPTRNAREGLPPTPGWLWLAGLAVCLINPHHIHAFTLPVELLPLPEALRQDVRFASLHISPWQMSLYYRPFTGINWAGGAYLLLLATGALSFLLNIRNWTGWRLLVWLTFAGLSAWLARTIPFFAVVAAPITALNLQDAFSRFPAQSRLLLGVSYLLLLLSSLTLIGLAWPGWLQGFQDSSHHVAWAVQPDSSLRRVAEMLRLWRQQGKLGDGRGFLADYSLVHYCAYYCPEEKGFLDPRVQLFRDVADQYEVIRQALNPNFSSSRRSSPPLRSQAELGNEGEDYPQKNTLSPVHILHKWGITYLVLYDPILPRLFPALVQLANDKGDWTLLDIEGQALIVGWRNEKGNLSSRMSPFDAERLAFTAAGTDRQDAGPTQKQEALRTEAPGQGPERGPRSHDFWSHFGKPIAPPSWPSETAAVLRNYFEARAPYEMQKRLSWTVALFGLPALSSGSLDGLMRLAVHIGHAPPNPLDLGQQPPALPLLTVRAARQALADNPDDANAYLQLGFAYLDLARRTPENTVLNLLRPLAELRHIQIATALENYLKCDPDSPNSLRVHEELATLYEGRFPPYLNPPFLDAALEHRRAALRLMRRIGPIPGEAADAFAHRLQEVEHNLQELERFISDRKNEFTLRSRNLGSEPYRKAELALRMGLARLTLEEILMPSSIVLLGGEGTRLQVRLQLMLGQVDSIREQIRSEDWRTNKVNLGLLTLDVPGNSTVSAYQLPAYEWLLLCQTVADGDYEEAEANVKGQLRNLALIQRELQSRIARMLGREIALRASPQIVAQSMMQQARLEMTALQQRFSETEVMFQVIAGMLALERGRPQEAKQAFHQARKLSRQGPGLLAQGPGASLAETYLRFLVRAPRNER
jgi:tetratricopeptide (TPR) repeat protein